MLIDTVNEPIINKCADTITHSDTKRLFHDVALLILVQWGVLSYSLSFLRKELQTQIIVLYNIHCRTNLVD